MLQTFKKEKQKRMKSNFINLYNDWSNNEMCCAHEIELVENDSTKNDFLCLLELTIFNKMVIDLAAAHTSN